MEDTIQRVVSFFQHAAQGLEERKQILYLLGPVGVPELGQSRKVSGTGVDISGLTPHIVARKGVVRTFQETTIFKGLTARDSVIVAHHLRSRASLVGFYLGTALARREEAEFGRSSYEILEFLGLGEVKNEIVSNLPQGHLRALGIAIGLAANPQVLLLDEPFAGMNHETNRAVEMVRAVRDRGVTLMLVEHDCLEESGASLEKMLRKRSRSYSL
jgi:branched-chain amino acid transport system ATP-binding protein